MKILFLVAGLLFSAQVFSQICEGQIAPTAFTDRYEFDLADETVVTDLATGLVWQRCVEGYTLNDGGTVGDIADDSCELPIELTDEDRDTSAQIVWTWLEAFQRVEAEGDGWRIPNIKELVSLAETACFTPSINTVVFPLFQTVTSEFTVTTDDDGVETVTFVENDFTTQLSPSVWSNTPVADSATAAWSLGFGDGSNVITDKPDLLFLRLVQN